MNKVAEQDRIVRILRGWQFDRERHGSLFDRGCADSYYGRARYPHFGGVGEDSGLRTEVTDEASVKEYMAGYDYNEISGEKKEWVQNDTNSTSMR